jgi:hypothetical protein
VHVAVDYLKERTICVKNCGPRQNVTDAFLARAEVPEEYVVDPHPKLSGAWQYNICNWKAEKAGPKN